MKKMFSWVLLIMLLTSFVKPMPSTSTSTTPAKPLKLAVLSDVHLMAPQLLEQDDSAFQAYLDGDRKLPKESSEILDSITARVLAEHPQVLFICGDLTKDGEFNDKDENGNKQEYAGNRFRLTPKNSFTIGADVELTLGKTSTVFFRPTYTYKSKVYFEDDNAPAQTAYGTYDLTQKGYGLCNFNLGWRCQPAKVYYEIGVFGKNIFDEKYIVDAGNSGRNIGFPTFIGGTRSVIGVQAKIGF